MNSPILPLIHTIAGDRIREAEASPPRAVTPEPQPQPRRIRSFVARLALSAPR